MADMNDWNKLQQRRALEELRAEMLTWPTSRDSADEQMLLSAVIEQIEGMVAARK